MRLARLTNLIPPGFRWPLTVFEREGPSRSSRRFVKRIGGPDKEGETPIYIYIFISMLLAFV